MLFQSCGSASFHLFLKCSRSLSGVLPDVPAIHLHPSPPCAPASMQQIFHISAFLQLFDLTQDLLFNLCFRLRPKGPDEFLYRLSTRFLEALRSSLSTLAFQWIRAIDSPYLSMRYGSFSSRILQRSDIRVPAFASAHLNLLYAL